MEGQELFYQKLYDITDQLLHLTDNHVLSSIIANYPPDTDMEQVLAEMKKIYGDTSPEMIAYELQLGYFYPERKDAVGSLAEWQRSKKSDVFWISCRDLPDTTWTNFQPE